MASPTSGSNRSTTQVTSSVTRTPATVRTPTVRVVADCVFCRIIAGEVPARVVLDDDRVLAFLDRTPALPRPPLLVPKVHVETLADLPDELIEPLFGQARRLSAVMETASAPPARSSPSTTGSARASPTCTSTSCPATARTA